MATIDDRRLVHEVDAAGTTALQTVLQAHQLVRGARLSHHRPGRTHPVHRRRRIRHPHAPPHRPAHFCETTAEPPTARPASPRRHRPVATVMIATVALALLYVGFLRVFEPNLNGRVLVVGVFLIAVAAAVCLNTVTLGAMTPPAARPAERAVMRVPNQGNLAGDTRDHSTEQSPRSDDE